MYVCMYACMYVLYIYMHVHHRPHSMDHAPWTMYQIPSTVDHAHCTRYPNAVPATHPWRANLQQLPGNILQIGPAFWGIVWMHADQLGCTLPSLDARCAA